MVAHVKKLLVVLAFSASACASALPSTPATSTPEIVYVTLAPGPAATVQIVYITPAPVSQPTPQIVYITPGFEPTPIVIYVTPAPILPTLEPTQVPTAVPEPTPTPLSISAACEQAFATAAAVDEMHDTVEDMYPAIRSCTLEEWRAQWDRYDGLGFIGTADEVLTNMCMARRVSATALCRSLPS